MAFPVEVSVNIPDRINRVFHCSLLLGLLAFINRQYPCSTVILTRLRIQGVTVSDRLCPMSNVRLQLKIKLNDMMIHIGRHTLDDLFERHPKAMHRLEMNLCQVFNDLRVC